MIKYPNGAKRSGTTNPIKQSKSGRGYSLENALNASNEYYLVNDLAIVHKKPTPIQIVKVHYPCRNAAKIVEAYFKVPSTTDYNGIYKGKYIDFEAKECQKNNFPFQNIHQHQIDHLNNVLRHGGLAFLIISFSKIHEVYLIDAHYVIEQYYNTTKHSFTYDEIKKHGHLIKQGFRPELDYLDIVDQLFFKEE